jgi:hypothetical protein
MFAPMLGVVRADLHRQVDWAGKEVQRQIRFALLIGAIMGMAAFAAFGALTVGLIALHSWIAPQVGSLPALGMIGAGLFLLMLVLLLVAYSLRRPGLKARPTLQALRAATLFRTGSDIGTDQVIATGTDSMRLATDTLRDGSRSELLGAIALIALAGVIAGRQLRRPEE